MGSCISSEITVVEKDGENYMEYKKHIKPLDLLLFKGSDFISDTIRFLQKKQLRPDSVAGYKLDADAFSHVGLVVTSEILDDDRLEEGVLYVFESTMSGRLTDGVVNIEGEGFLGVQLRELDLVVQCYDKPEDSRIAVAPIKQNILQEVWGGYSPELKKAFTTLFGLYNGNRYDANFYTLFASLNRCMRPVREEIEHVAGTEEWLFCSELVALIYRELKFLPKSVEPDNFVPMDFVGFDDDVIDVEIPIPIIVEKPVYITYRGE